MMMSAVRPERQPAIEAPNNGVKVLKHDVKVLKPVVPSPLSTPTDKTDNNQSEERDTTAYLHQKLATVLLELEKEKENLQLAASAGKSLLEQLTLCQEEKQALRDEVDARAVDLQYAERENDRLKQMCAAMEEELRQYDSAWSALEQQHQTQTQTPPKQTQTQTQIRDQADHLNQIERLETEVRNVRKENEVLKHRCLELEIQHDKVANGWSELHRLNKKNESCLKRVQADYAKALADIDYMSAQIKYLKEDHCNLIATRDQLRITTRRLQSENDGLTKKLEDATAKLDKWTQEKKANAASIQVTENKLSTLGSENQALHNTLAACQTRLQALETEAQANAELKAHATELERLLEDATARIRQLETAPAVMAPSTTVMHLARLRTESIESHCASSVVSCRTTTSEEDQATEEDDEDQEDQGSITPLYVGLSLVACATAVRYLVRR